MTGRKILRDGKTEPGPLGTARHERVKNFIGDVSGNAGPIIFDVDARDNPMPA